MLTLSLSVYYLYSKLVNCLSDYQDVHAPILSLWGVKILVISLFAALALSSIVSPFSFRLYAIMLFAHLSTFYIR